MKRPRAAEAEKVRPWLCHTQGLGEYRGHGFLKRSHLALRDLLAVAVGVTRCSLILVSVALALLLTLAYGLITTSTIEAVPLRAHERKPVRWVCNNGVHGVRFHGRHDLGAVAVMYVEHYSSNAPAQMSGSLPSAHLMKCGANSRTHTETSL